MKRKLLLINVLCICSLCIAISFFSFEKEDVQAFSNQVIQHGAVGDDVIELQSRLQYLGFYTGKIDGVFGWRTYWALRNFQYEFGMKIDGLAGEKTKNKLVNASKYNDQFVKEQIKKGNKFTHYGGVDIDKQKAPKKGAEGQGKAPQQAPQQGQGGKAPQQAPQQGQGGKAPQQGQAGQPAPQQGQGGQAEQPPAPQEGQGGTTQEPAPQQGEPEQAAPQKPTATNVPGGFSQNDIQLMANAVYGEARGEPYIGQVAIAAVILNRVESATFPNTVSGVIFEPRAFTAVADGQIYLTPNEQAKKAVVDALNGWDPTGNAIYYFNPDTATSAWIWSRPQIKKIGRHIFCK